jgi:RNA polymerase sigma-70 factor, ECF subfamily
LKDFNPYNQSVETRYKSSYQYGVTVALYYVRDLDTAISVYNDAFMKVLEVDISTIENYKAWLRRVVVNAAIDYNRKYFRNDNVTIHEFDALGNQLPNLAIDHLENIDLLKIVKSIATSYRTVFLLHVVEGFKFVEIAEQLNITEGGAKTLYHKAKQKLQHIISTEYQEYGYRKI